MVTANTFGANGFKYKKDEGYSLGSIVTAGVSLAKEAVKEAGHGYAALDLGPTGRLLAPCGDLDFEDACKAYKEVVEAGVRAGADLIVIETMGDSYELKAAVLVAKEVSSLPVFATVTLDERGKCSREERWKRRPPSWRAGSGRHRPELWSGPGPAAAVHEAFKERLIPSFDGKSQCRPSQERERADRV